MTQDGKSGERIAKVLARAGVASRREAERMIAAGLVTVNGKVIESAALDVTAADRIAVEGKPLGEKEPTRLWLYYKPLGLVTSSADEKGRDTVFDHLPEELPRVMPVGRLDLNSEGLLLLTNDGELKRRLELPSTGWLRKYRVRVNGEPTEEMLEPLRKGIEVEGEQFQGMTVEIDRQQGANAWLTVGLREGRNREIRRAMAAVGLTVNRLIRVSYGPFRLGEMAPGAVEEVRPKVLRDQLGLKAEAPATERQARRAAAEGVPVARAGRKPAAGGASRVGRMAKPGTEVAEAAPEGRKARRAARAPAVLAKARAAEAPAGAERGRKPRTEGDAKKPRWKAEGMPERAPREGGERPRKFERGPKPEGADAERPRTGGFKRGPRPEGGGSDRPRSAGGPRGPRPEGAGADRPRSEGFKRGPRPGGDASERPREGGFKRGPRAEAGAGGGPRGDRPKGPPRSGGPKGAPRSGGPKGAPRSGGPKGAPRGPRKGG